MEERDFLQTLMAQYCEALERSEALTFIGIGYCENTFAGYRERFLISFSVFATRKTRPYNKI